MESWFSLLSKNEDFVTALRHILREATCRLILKIKDVSIGIGIGIKVIVPLLLKLNVPVTLILMLCPVLWNSFQLDIPKIITYKLLPCALNHHKIVQKMIKNGVPLDKLADSFYANEYQIHPAVRSRQSELDYLRAVARCLLPRLCINQKLDSKVFFSLVRELLACFVLLPFMDVLCCPNFSYWYYIMILY